VQMIYMDPPYGIKYASNFQTRINPRDVKNNREPDHSKVCLRQATHQMDNSDGGRYDHKTWVPWLLLTCANNTRACAMMQALPKGKAHG